MATAIATLVLNDGDAVGNDVLGMAKALRARGETVRLFAEKSRLNEEVYPLRELRGTSDTLIYHHSMQCDIAVSVVEGARGLAIVKYHNVTPQRFFSGVDADAVRSAEIGVQQAVRMARAGVRMWVDSTYNGRDLEHLAPGTSWQELSPFHQADDLVGSHPDAESLGGLDAWATTFLCVGRVAPNKNGLLAVEAFAEYAAKFEPQSRLIFAGEHIYPAYSERIALRANELGVADRVIFAGRVTVSQLKALYLSADALLVTSEHEGFCVPLLEAMALGVPVVAVPMTAVPDTAGDAAFYADANAVALARTLADAVYDGQRREQHLLNGRHRYDRHFSTDAIRLRFAELLSA